MLQRNKPTKYYSKKQETRVAKKLNMRTQSNSGATPFAKGDVADANVLLECKTITKEQKSRTIQKDWFTELEEERIAMRKDMCAVVFDFGDGKDYYAIDEATFKDLYECWKEVRGGE